MCIYFRKGIYIKISLWDQKNAYQTLISVFFFNPSMMLQTNVSKLILKRSVTITTCYGFTTKDKHGITCSMNSAQIYFNIINKRI